MELPPENPPIRTVSELVTLVVHRYKLPACEVWNYTIPELVMMLNDPEQPEEADNAIALAAQTRKALDKRNAMDSLNVVQLLELEEWIDELT